MGLLAALATGLGALAWGYPFLTSHTAHFSLPVVGEIHVASALFFDIGVFTLVVGSTLLILTAIAHQSIRGHRYHARLQEEARAAQENSMESDSSPYPASAESYQKVNTSGGAV